MGGRHKPPTTRRFPQSECGKLSENNFSGKVVWVRKMDQTVGTDHKNKGVGHPLNPRPKLQPLCLPAVTAALAPPPTVVWYLIAYAALFAACTVWLVACHAAQMKRLLCTLVGVCRCGSGIPEWRFFLIDNLKKLGRYNLPPKPPPPGFNSGGISFPQGGLYFGGGCQFFLGAFGILQMRPSTKFSIKFSVCASCSTQNVHFPLQSC